MTTRPDPSQLPTGTVTFMFTDIEGSTELARSLGDSGFAELLKRHHYLVRTALTDGDGIEVSTEGDSFFAVFTDVVAAVVAAVDIQRRISADLSDEGETVRVRCGVHTGVGLLGGDNYSGVDVHKASRVSSAAHGGQIIVSDVTAQLVRDRLPSDFDVVNLGKFRLEGFPQSETLHQVNAAGLTAEFPAPSAPPAMSRLPMPLTEFVGRELEMAQVIDAIAEHRLVTLTGPGGTGKSRLAIEAARELEPGFSDGAVFVALASISDPGLIAATILDTLELKTASGVEPADHLRRYLADRRMLLVLDNLEQLVEGAPVISRFLEEAPNVKVIATSRTPLRVSGERELPVPPLAVPELGASPGDIGGIAGVVLFASRAAAVRPGFEVDQGNAAAVAGIARSLDGLPLAIELAASRMRTLTPEAIFDRLNNQLLAAPSSDLPTRQQTMVNAIGWSYDLLSPPVRILFEQLSVFSGGFGLTEAEKVCNGLDVLDGLVELVDHSLVRQTETSGEPRFRMLTVIREFGYAALVARGDEQEVLDAHSRVYVELVEAAEAEILTSKQDVWLGRLAADHDNIRAAFDRAVDAGDHVTALRIAGGMWRFWQIKGLLEEGQIRIEAALALPGEHDPVQRARALGGLGGLIYWRGQLDRIVTPYQEALDLYRQVGDERGVAESLYNLSFSKGYSGEIEEGIDLLEQSIAISQRIGWEIGVARAKWGMGSHLAFTEDWDRCLAYSLEAIAEFEKHDAPFDLGWAWFMAANAQVRGGDVAEARRAIVASLETFARVRDLSALPLVYDLFAQVLFRLGDRSEAAWFSGAVQRLQEDTGVEVGGLTINRHPDLIQFIENLNPEEQVRFDEGYQAPTDDTVARALAYFG